MEFLGSLKPLITSEDAERRSSQRKQLKVSALIGTAESGILHGHTLDISAGGLSVMSPVPLQPGTLCSVRFHISVNGNKLNVIGASRVMNCSCSGMGGFRVGMMFKIKDAQIQDALYEYLNLRDRSPS